MKPAILFATGPVRGWLPWGLLAPFLAIAFVAAPALSLMTVWERLHLADVRGEPIGFAGLVAFLLVEFGLAGLLVGVWVRVVERRPLAAIGLTPSGGGGFVWGHLIGMATLGLVVAAIWAAGGLRADGYGPAFVAPVNLLKAGVLLLAFAVQASVEEVLFRGWLLSVIARKFNLVAAVIVTTAVFALLHFSRQQPWLFTLNVILFGVFTACWAIKANNIWGVMGWHAGWNWLLATGFELPVTGLETDTAALLVRLVPQGPTMLTGGAEGPEGSLAATAFFTAGIVVLLWRMRRRRGPS